MNYNLCYVVFAWLVAAGLPTSSGFVSTAILLVKPTLTITLSHGTRNFLPPPSIILNAVAPEIWTNALPPAMGLVKSEWTVSYGYGFASSLSALSLLVRTGITPNNNPIFPLQAAALIFYGLRLNAFLFIRNRISSRMQEFQKNMEERAVASSRLARIPAVLGCGLLYYALYAPLLLTSMMSGNSAAPPVALMAMKGLVALQWCGYLMGAVGDFTKSYVKKSQGNERFLVTSGIFSLLRHPNYTGKRDNLLCLDILFVALALQQRVVLFWKLLLGEIIAWTCNSLLGTLAGAYLLRNQFRSNILGYLCLNLVGWIGIVFVLLTATGNLEERQKIDYGETEKYKQWVESTWSGWYLPKRSEELERHEITMDDELVEESGSGI
jgi:steroid 5-alpha reductase family enzyme